MAAQSWILHTQVAEETVAAARYPVVICDRSVIDNYVYMVLAAGEREPFETLVAHWIRTYDLLVHVPIAGHLQPDGIRAPDPAFQRLVEEQLDRELARRALVPLRLDRAAREGWLDAVEAAVWQRLRPAQLVLRFGRGPARWAPHSWRRTRRPAALAWSSRLRRSACRLD